MLEALGAVATGEVTVASRDVELDGVAGAEGRLARLADGEAVASSGRASTRSRARSSSGCSRTAREVLTLLTGADEPALDGIAASCLRGAASGGRARGAAGRPAALPAAALGRVRWRATPQRIRILLVEDNDVFRAGARAAARAAGDIEVVAPSATAGRGRRLPRAPAGRLLMDYRLPGIDGVEATARCARSVPDVAVVCLTASAGSAGGRRAARRRAPSPACEGSGARRDRGDDRRRGRPEAGAAKLMKLTRENTAIVLDSTADFPEAPERFPNMRVVPLYVRFGDESFRDYVELGPDDFYDRLRAAASCRRPRSRRRRTSSRSTRSSRATSASSRSTSPAKLSGHVRQRRPRGAGARRRPRAPDRHARPRRSRSRCSRSRSSGRLERGTTDEEVDALVERYAREAGLLFTVDTLEYLAKGGRIGRARALAGQLLNIKPILTITRRRGRAAQARARVRGRRIERVRHALRGGHSADAAGLRVGIAHADAPERVEALAEMVRDARPQAEIELVTTLGAGRRHARGARAPSASSGSTDDVAATSDAGPSRRLLGPR